MRHVVFPMMAGIGNTLMAVPMVRQLKRAWPDAKVTVLARLKVTAEPFQRLKEVDEVRVTGVKLSALWKHTRQVRREGTTAYIIPFPSNRWQYTLLAYLSGAEHKVLHGYDVGYVKALHFLPTTRVASRRGVHDVVSNLDLLRALGIEPDYTEAPVFVVNDDDRRRATEKLRGAGFDDSTKPIFIHAGCRDTVLAAAKRWAAPNYGGLIAGLVERFGDRVLLVEGPEEQGVIDDILPHCPVKPHTLKLTGPLADTAAILERSELYVGTDSGLAHLAASVGTTPVTLFAPADPARTAPFGYRHLAIQPPGKTCSPCFHYPLDACKPGIKCRPPMCIDAIPASLVLEKVDEVRASRAVGLVGVG
jgi:ADP-heptose:LPS heptosyltransferase